jgi:hypothetical protein
VFSNKSRFWLKLFWLNVNFHNHCYHDLYSTNPKLSLKILMKYHITDKVCQWLAVGRWFSPGTPVSSTNKTDHHNINEVLLKVALNTITLIRILIHQCNITFNKYRQSFSHIVSDTFIDGRGNWSALGTPPVCRKSLINFLKKVVSDTRSQCRRNQTYNCIGDRHWFHDQTIMNMTPS